MSSPTMLPVDPTEIGLSAHHLAIFSVPTGQTLRVDAAALRHELEHLDDTVTTLVFVHESTERGTIRDMLERFSATAADALSCFTRVTEAVKQVDDDIVQAGLDRSTIVALTGPQVVSRAALAEAMAQAEVAEIDPTAAVAALGGRVALYGDEHAE